MTENKKKPEIIVESGTCFFMLRDRRKYHIVTNFRDNETLFYVYKFYGIYKQWWHYKLITHWELHDKIALGIYGWTRKMEPIF